MYAETTRNDNSGFSLGACFIVLIIAAVLTGLIYFAATAYPSTHAVEKHGEAAMLVVQCLNSNGPLETWYNPDTNRTANIVCLDNGQYGIEICDGEGNQITCFIKEKLKSLEKVRKYLENRGYSD